MDFSKEDLDIVAKKAKMTPEEVLDILQEVKPELKLTHEPGLSTLLSSLLNKKDKKEIL